MAPKLTPKIILEGTRLTFKTDLAFALNEHPRVVGPRRYRYHSPLVSGEWCAFTNSPWGRGLINFAPHEEALAMETYATWARLFELQRYYSWIVDRFHLSTRMFQFMAHGKDYDFRWLEERLRPLNFRLVYCTRSPESFAAARAKRLLVSGKPDQYDPPHGKPDGLARAQAGAAMSYQHPTPNNPLWNETGNKGQRLTVRLAPRCAGRGSLWALERRE